MAKQIFGWTEPTYAGPYVRYMAASEEGEGNVAFSVRDQNGYLSYIVLPSSAVDELRAALASRDTKGS